VRPRVRAYPSRRRSGSRRTSPRTTPRHSRARRGDRRVRGLRGHRLVSPRRRIPPQPAADSPHQALRRRRTFVVPPNAAEILVRIDGPVRRRPPARHAYSHSASLGSRKPASLQNSCASSHDTVSTGWSALAVVDGFVPVTSSHAACVVSVRQMRNGSAILTPWGVPAPPWRKSPNVGDPIWNIPPRMRLNSRPSPRA